MDLASSRRRFSVHVCAGLAAVASTAASAPDPGGATDSTARIAGADRDLSAPRARPITPRVGAIGQRMGGGDDEPPPPRIRTAAPSITGTGLAATVVRRIVMRNVGQLMECYQTGLSERPNLRGRITIHFVIAPSGSVTEAAVAGQNLAVPSVGDCVSDAIKRFTFPAPEGGGTVTVNFPISFSPR